MRRSPNTQPVVPYDEIPRDEIIQSITDGTYSAKYGHYNPDNRSRERASGRRSLRRAIAGLALFGALVAGGAAMANKGGDTTASPFDRETTTITLDHKVGENVKHNSATIAQALPKLQETTQNHVAPHGEFFDASIQTGDDGSKVLHVQLRDAGNKGMPNEYTSTGVLNYDLAAGADTSVDAAIADVAARSAVPDTAQGVWSSGDKIYGAEFSLTVTETGAIDSEDVHGASYADDPREISRHTDTILRQMADDFDQAVY
jgi:hypothetical protein